VDGEGEVEIFSEVVVLHDGLGAVEAVDADEAVAGHGVVADHRLRARVAHRHARVAVVADDVVLEDDVRLGADHDAVGVAGGDFVVEQGCEAARSLHVDPGQEVPVHVVVLHPQRAAVSCENPIAEAAPNLVVCEDSESSIAIQEAPVTSFQNTILHIKIATCTRIIQLRHCRVLHSEGRSTTFIVDYMVEISFTALNKKHDIADLNC
jgi:hypothetical protein